MAEQCHALLCSEGIPYSACGGVAVCLHGYQRNTIDLNLIIRPEDIESVREVLARGGFVRQQSEVEFRSPSGIAVHFWLSGRTAGRGTKVRIPVPTGELNVEACEGLTVVRLSRLIEMKLACGMSNLRSTHKDFADVVELIAARQLDQSFARFLHPSLRATYRDLVRNAQADPS